MESASIADDGGVQAEEPTLKAGAIGFVSNIVIGVASVAPGYSLAATLGFIAAVGGLGYQAPATIIVAFFPMAAIAYYFLNKADPDCGTTFSWMTKAMGPIWGWQGGWAIVVADVLVMPNLAQIAGQYTLNLFGDGTPSNTATLIVGIVWIALMTRHLLHRDRAERRHAALAADARVRGPGDPRRRRADQGLHRASAALGAPERLLVQPVRDQGRDHGVAGHRRRRGLWGLSNPVKNTSDVFSPLGHSVFGSLHFILTLAILSSASASTQTTILPTARTTLSMGHAGAIPRQFGNVHPRFRSAGFSTIWMGTVSAIPFAIFMLTSTNLIRRLHVAGRDDRLLLRLQRLCLHHLLPPADLRDATEVRHTMPESPVWPHCS